MDQRTKVVLKRSSNKWNMILNGTIKITEVMMDDKKDIVHVEEKI